MFLVEDAFTVSAELDELIFIFSGFSVIILVETFKLHKKNDVVRFDHALEHHTEFGLVTA